MLKMVLGLGLIVTASVVGSAYAMDGQIVTSCSGKDNRGNAISLTVLQDNSAKEYSSSNAASRSIELQAPSGPLHYVVLDSDAEEGDASLNAKSDDNGGIQLKTEGNGLITSGTIGALKSQFKFSDCKAGPAAPMPW